MTDDVPSTSDLVDARVDTSTEYVLIFEMISGKHVTFDCAKLGFDGGALMVNPPSIPPNSLVRRIAVQRNLRRN